MSAKTTVETVLVTASDTFDLEQAMWRPRYLTGTLFDRTEHQLMGRSATIVAGVVTDRYTGTVIQEFDYLDVLKDCGNNIERARQAIIQDTTLAANGYNRDYHKKYLQPIEDRIHQEAAIVQNDSEQRWNFSVNPDGTVVIFDSNGLSVTSLPNLAATHECWRFRACRIRDIRAQQATLPN